MSSPNRFRLSGRGAAGFLALVFSAWALFTWVGRFAGLTVSIAKIPEAAPIWTRALQTFLISPLLQCLVAAVLAIGWLGLLYLPKLIAVWKLDHSDTLHRWSVSVDINSNLSAMSTNKGACLFLDVTLTNHSALYARTLEFRVKAASADEAIVLSTEHSRDQPYRRALVETGKSIDPLLLPLVNPVAVPAQAHVEGRVEIDVPPHISEAWFDDFEKWTHLAFSCTLEVFDRSSGQTIELTLADGWDGVRGEKRPLRRRISY